MLSLAYNLPKTTPNFSDVSKVRPNKVDFLAIKIKSKKVSRNTLDISTREITSRKVHENNVKFSTVKITSKKY